MSEIKEENKFSPWSANKRSRSSNKNGITAKLVNTINGIGFGAFNHQEEINHGDILSSYSPKVLEETWMQFSNFIKKNYESGRGTNIKGFGTFTFTSVEYNLEGTTNQYKRDIKLRRPVFIVSNEFLDFLKPGQFTKRGGLIYYNQKQSSNLTIVKLNYSEIAFSLNISKEECFNILTHMIKDIGKGIVNKTFKSRELPGLGILLIRGNIFGVKFFNDFNMQSYKKVEHLNLTKKNLELYTDVHKTDQSAGDIINAEKAFKKLVPEDTVITHLVDGADTWLKNNLDINPNDYDNDTESVNNFNKVENYDRNKKWNAETFYQAPQHSHLYKTPQGLMYDSKKKKNNRKINNILSDTTSPINKSTEQMSKTLSSLNSNKMSLKTLGYPNEVLEAIVANKGQIIKEMKSYDRRGNGLISRFELVRSFNSANIHPCLSINNFNDIVKLYAEGQDYIDYHKMITSLIKEIKQMLKNTPFSKYAFDDLSSTFNNKFLLGNGDVKKNSSRTPKPENINQRFLSQTCTNFKKRNENNILNNFDENEYNNMIVSIEEVEKEIMTIKLIFGEVMHHKKTHFRSVELEIFLDDNNIINYNDFILLLRTFGITYPLSKILKILKFIKIENPCKMTLNILNEKLLNCKITSSEMDSHDLEYALKYIIHNEKLNLKNKLFTNATGENIILKQFLKATHNKTIYSDNILTELFYKMSNKEPQLNKNVFLKLYSDPIYCSIGENPNLTRRFYEKSCERIHDFIKSKGINVNDYFNKLLCYNYRRGENKLAKVDFRLSILQEDITPQFKEDELNFIFDNMDLNKDGFIDRNEFKTEITKEHNALFKMQDICKNLKLSTEDLAFRLDIDLKNLDKTINFYTFKTKLKRMDYYYTNEFIEGLYIELVGSLDKNINCKYLLEKLNVYKKGSFNQTNNETFKKNFIANIQKSVDYHTIKSMFEKEDKNFSGKISKEKFCKIINSFTNDFKDEDLVKFVRTSGVTDDKTYEVKYSDFIDLIYYNETKDLFLLCINEIKKLWEANGKDINKIIKILNKNNGTNYIANDQLLSYLQKVLLVEDHTLNEKDLNKTLLSKFDLDSDGKISYEDLCGILQRYTNTAFFKYENSEKGQFVNLYASDILTEEQFKAIVREIKNTMKKKNLTEVGLFKKLDENNDGFINNYEFNKNISEVISISPATKDKIFNYLDCYHNGMVDLETFLLRFKEFRSNEVIVHNNNTIENVISDKLVQFIIKHSNTLNDSELFCMIDKDSDGLISLEDFKHFVLDSLGISKIEFNDFKLERVMQSISLSKNKNIGLGDIREFMNKALSKQGIEHYYVDLKETFKETTNQNLYRGKLNTEWITQAIERFGMYVTEKFDNAKNFFELFKDKKSNKFKLENFIKFHENNYECFHGFNLTRDELLAIFTSLDSQKKNYLNLDDLTNKIELFDFYRKMHLDVKNFLHDNFPTYIDSFKFFLPSTIKNVNKGLVAIDEGSHKFNKTFTKGFYRPFDSSGIINSNASGLKLKRASNNENCKTNSINVNNNKNNSKLTYITKKEFFNGMNNLFPNKYPTETILKYMKKYFNINIDKVKDYDEKASDQIISFSQYCFVYYGKVCNDKDILTGGFDINISNNAGANFMQNRPTKISTTRSTITAKCVNAFDEMKLKNEMGRIPRNNNLYPNEEEIISAHSLEHMDHPLEFLAHEKLVTPFDSDPLEKVRRIIQSSPNINYQEKMKGFLDSHYTTNGIVNEFEFKNMLKSLYLGLTNIEIDDIIRKSGRTYDGKVNMHNFYKYVTSIDKNIVKANLNLNSILSEIKQLLYKFYSNPKLAFSFSDLGQTNQMDFEKYKSIIIDLYKRENKNIPNFALLKNTYDYIDLRKDGLIDMNEWTNAFGNLNGKLDALKPASAKGKNQLKAIRRWETSNDVISIYKDISRNRKMISEKVKETSFGKNAVLIHEDNLIKVLKDIFPLYRLTNTQWKMIVEIGEKNTEGFVNFDTFIKLAENCSKREEMPRFK